MYYRHVKPSLVPAVAVLSVLLVFSAVVSRGELDYILRGREVSATIDSAVDKFQGEVGQRGRRLVKDVTFHFLEAEGTKRQGRDEVYAYWEVPESGTVQINYIPGRDGSARVVGNGPKVFPALFVFCLFGLTSIGVVRAYEESNRRARLARRRLWGEEESDAE